MAEATAIHPLTRLLRQVRRHRRRIGAATLFSVLNKIFDLAPPLLIGAAVDVVVKREDSWIASWGIEAPSTQLWILAVITVCIWLLESVFEYLQSIYWRNLAQTIQHEIRLEGYTHTQGLDLAYFESRSTGHLLSVLNDDVNQLERFLDSGANELLQVGTTVIVIGALFFSFAPQVAWLAFLPIPIILWGSFTVQRRLAPRYAEVRERVGGLSDLLTNNIGGIATIKSFTAESHEAKRLEGASEEYLNANRRAIRLSSAFSPLIRIVIVLGFAATLVWGGQAVFDDDLAVGVYSVMVFMTQRLLWPLTRLGQTVDLYQRAMASTTRVLDLIDTPVRVRGGSAELDSNAVEGRLAFEAVTFGYQPDQAILHDLDLEFRAGKTTALVGATGGGKSSVLKLLLRFYAPTAGNITLDGRSLEDFRLDDLRRAIGFVSQDVFLFSGSVRENISYGSLGATPQDIESAARAAEAHDFIQRLPHGYDTIVGERGIRLSGGQRQRLSIARAVLKDPPILLLDEATSAVDNETEAAIQRSLKRISVDRTTVLVAHRLSTIRHADRIYVLDQGRVAEEGTHEELIRRDGLYGHLWRVQTGESDD